MKSIQFELKANKDTFIDIRDYGYNCGVHKMKVISNGNGGFSNKYPNFIPCVSGGIGIKFPIIDGKSPCVFYFRSTTALTVQIFIEELGGICDKFYFDTYEILPPEYYVTLSTDSDSWDVKIGTCTVSEDRNSLVVNTWGENVLEATNYPLNTGRTYKVNGSENFKISLGVFNPSYGFYGFSIDGDNNVGARIYAEKSRLGENSLGYGFIILVDLTREDKPTYCVTPAPFNYVTKTEYLETGIELPNINNRATTIGEITYPNNCFEGSSSDNFRRISEKFLLTYSGSDIDDLKPKEL